jgi:pyruvate,water dikinase
VTELVRGVSASTGTKEGTVALLLSIADAFAVFSELTADTVLVVPEAGPDWTPVLLKVGAIVTDVGGVLSHPAIVARQAGIPCVVGTRTGTTVLHDQMRVVVDGSAGVVLSVP